LRYSHSHLKLYAGCPFAEDEKYRKEIPEQSSEDARRGSRLHKVLYDYGVHCLEQGVPTDLDYLRGHQGTDEEREILETFADTHMFDLAAGNHFEVPLEVEVGGYGFKAVIDHLEMHALTIVIRDYKTFYKILPQTEVDKDRQLRRYAVVVSKAYPGITTFVCQMDFVRYGVVREVIYTIEYIPTLEAELIADIEQVENATEFPATPGAYCDWCSYTNMCPAMEAGNVDVIQTLEEAEAAAANLIALDARRAAQKKPLEEWCSKQGLVTVNGKATGYYPEERYEYPDKDQLAELLYGRGVDPDLYFKPDTTKIKAAAKKDPELADALKVIAIDKSQTKFASRKVKES